MLIGAACAHDDGPEAILSQYHRALADGKAGRVYALSASSVKEGRGVEELSRWIAKNPRLRESAQRRTQAEPTRIVTTISTAEGPIKLIKEGRSWRVLEGGLFVPQFDTPERALRTFFFAATGHLGLLRKLIPNSEASAYASDYALGKRLYEMRERIFRVQAELGPIWEGRAEIVDDRAFIRYQKHKTVSLLRQEGRWRVVDLE